MKVVEEEEKTRLSNHAENPISTQLLFFLTTDFVILSEGQDHPVSRTPRQHWSNSSSKSSVKFV